MGHPVTGTEKIKKYIYDDKYINWDLHIQNMMPVLTFWWWWSGIWLVVTILVDLWIDSQIDYYCVHILAHCVISLVVIFYYSSHSRFLTAATVSLGYKLCNYSFAGRSLINTQLSQHSTVWFRNFPGIMGFKTKYKQHNMNIVFLFSCRISHRQKVTCLLNESASSILQ